MYGVFFVRRIAKFLIFSFVLLGAYSFVAGKKCFAQEKILVSSATDSVFIQNVFDSALKQESPDSSIRIFLFALNESVRLNFYTGVALSYMGVGLKYIDKGDYPQSLLNFTQALPWCVRSGNKETLTSCYINLGLSYLYQGDYVMSVEKLLEALRISNTIHPPLPRLNIKVYGNLSIVYYRMGQRNQSIKYLEVAEQIARKEKMYYLVAMTLNNKGGLYSAEEYLTARSLYYESLAIAEKYNYTDLQAYGFENIGETYIDSKEYDTAIPYLEKAILLSENRYNYVFTVASYALGDALYHLKRYKEAEAILVSATQAAEKTNLKDNQTQGYGVLTLVYKATGQYQKAVKCLEIIAKLKDSSTSAEKAKEINLLEYKYKTAEKDKQLAEKELLIARQKIKITNANIWITIVVCSIVLLIVTTTSQYLNRRKRHLIQIKTIEQEGKISVLKAAVQGADKERSRIAAELHDGIGGMLSAAMMRFMAIHHDNKEITNIPAYQEAMNLLDEMGDEIRKTAHNLMPEVLLKQNLPEAVQSFCNFMKSNGTLEIEFQHYGNFDGVSQDLKLSVYRIIQELIKNIQQHAAASQAFVQLTLQEQILMITVEDNGIGFNVGTTKTGMGLHNLSTRVSSLDGYFTIESKQGKGTSVNIEFDLGKDFVNAAT